MRNLFRFIVKYHFLLLFLALEVICFCLIILNRSFQSTAIINSANKVSGTLYAAVANGKEYLLLKEENYSLAEENRRLKNAMKSSYEIISLDTLVRNDTLFRKKYVYTLGRIINSKSSGRTNYLTLNIGKKQGVERDNAIVNADGIVGIVKDVSDNFCTATSILHKDQKVSVKFKKDGSSVVLSWEEGDDAFHSTLINVPTHVRMVKGDTIVTSHLSDLFPEGVTVGTIESYEKKKGEAFFTVRIRLSADFKKLNYVYVIKNIYKEEKDSLENIIKKEEQNRSK